MHATDSLSRRAKIAKLENAKIRESKSSRRRDHFARERSARKSLKRAGARRAAMSSILGTSIFWQTWSVDVVSHLLRLEAL